MMVALQYHDSSVQSVQSILGDAVRGPGDTVVNGVALNMHTPVCGFDLSMVL